MATKTRPSAITKLSDTPSDGNKNWLIYGKSGDGKTVLAGTAPNSIFLSVEAAGTESAKAMGSDADEWVVDSLTKLDEAYDYFKNGSGCKDYEWVILDSLTEIEELFWGKVQGSNMGKKIQDYGTVATMMKREIDRWNRLPINVLYTAHTMQLEIEDEDGDDATLTLPGMGTSNGSLSQKVCAKTTLNGYLIVKTGTKDGVRIEQRRLMLRGNSAFIAKDRHMIAPPKGYIVDADIAEMAAAADAAATKGKAKKSEKASASTKEED